MRQRGSAIDSTVGEVPRSVALAARAVGLIVLLASVSRVTLSQTVTVLTPNGGEMWDVGSTQAITWGKGGGVGPVSIKVSRDGGTTWPQIDVVPAAPSSYDWIVTGPESASCLVQITDTTDSLVTDDSDATFTIVGATVTSPNGGETWFPNSTHKVTWTSVGLTNVLIRYSTDGGGVWTQAVASTDAAAGYYEWTLPSANSGNCLVEVADAVDGTPADQSDLPFTISFGGAGVFVDAPVSGDRWPVGPSQDIEWTSFNVTNVRIELSRDGGSAWEDLAASTPAAGSPFTWPQVTGPGSTNCLVRVSDADSPINSPLHYSGVFKIADIVVTQPNGSEVWDVNSSQTITWTSTDVVNVRIEVSRVGGSPPWDVIIASTPAAAGSYTWNPVAGPTSADCVVRVSDAAGAASDPPFDVSDASFEIVDTGQTVAVTAPNGTEVWDTGTSRDITWTSVGITDVKVEVSRDGGTVWEDIVASTPAAGGSYAWDPVTGSGSTNCIVRVSDAVDGSPWDVSDAPFTIAEAVMTQPNGTELWDVGTSQSITWTSTALTDVRIELSRDDGSTWEDIVASTPAAAGAYTWDPVTGSGSTNCIVRVSDAVDGSPRDVSDAPFAIAEAVVTQPNGAEVWDAGTSHNITWTSAGMSDVWIELSRDGGTTWEDIVASTPAAGGAYTWDPVTGSGSTICLIRVSDAADGAPWDVSDATFTIAETVVTAPNGAEVWDVGSSQSITWTSTALTDVRIELSRDGGTAWEDIVASTPAAAGSFPWDPVTGSGSTNCLVRVSDASDGSPWDVSDTPFTVAGITLTAPIGAEVWVTGTSQDVTWISAGFADVRIELSRNGGTIWEDIVASTPAAAGSYTWPSVTAPVSGTCLVRVSDAADASPSDVSASPFEIATSLQTVAVTSPNGSETWDVGSTQNITWTSSGLTDVRIELSRNNGTTWEDIVASAPAAGGAYTWTSVTIPDSQDNCVVRVSDAADGSPSDISDAAFSIAGAAWITVTVPDGAETWYYGGASQDITWTSFNVTGTVDVEYSIDSGSNWVAVAAGEANDGAYTWTIPDEDSAECLVRVFESVGAASDESDATFTITPATVTVVAPDGTEVLDPGATVDVTWTSAGLGNVSIELSRDGGASYEYLITSTAAVAGSFTWDVVGTGSDNCLVRVSDAADGAPSDVSDGAFTIAGITVTSPVGGEIWLPDFLHSITWEAPGVANVKIEVSRDGGASWDEITASTDAASGSYAWMVTEPGSARCRIRVSDAVDGVPSGTSAADFYVGLPDEALAEPYLGTGCAPSGREGDASDGVPSVAWLLCLAGVAALTLRARSAPLAGRPESVA